MEELIRASLVLIEIEVSNPSMLLQGVLSSSTSWGKGFRFVKKDTTLIFQSTSVVKPCTIQTHQETLTYWKHLTFGERSFLTELTTGGSLGKFSFIHSKI